MPGVGFSRHPDPEETDDNQIHLWKSAGEGSSETHCEDHTVDIGLSSKGMTQVTTSQIDSWKDNPSVCDNCVEAVDDWYNSD